MPGVRAGRMRAIAIGTRTRQSAAPDVPTFAEAGFADFEAIAWWGVFAPAGVPAAIVGKLHREIVKALKTSEVAQIFAAQGLDLKTSSPEEFARFIKADMTRMGEVIRSASFSN